MDSKFLDLGPGRPTPRLAAALAAVTVGIVLAAAGGGANAGSSVSLTYKQSVASAHFKAENVSELAPGSGYAKLCWELTEKGGKSHTWCVTRQTPDGPWKLTGKKRGVKTEIKQQSALLAVNPQDAGIAPGLYKWNVAITPCQAEPTGSTGPTATPAADCAVRYPSEGGKTVRIHSLRPIGCKVKGRSQVSSGKRRGKKIALTFDDGPAADTTQFLNELKKLKIHVTFFMIGQQVASHKSDLKRMIAEGHELANHTWSHADVSGAGGAARSQLSSTNHAIERASGFTPCLMRPPGGATSGSLASLVRSMKMTSVLWDVDPQDWRTPGTGTIVNTIRSQTRAGSIILEHDGGGPRGQTLAAIPQYVKTLKKRGYKFVTVSELLGYKTVYALNK